MSISRRFKSRKFWLTIAASVTLILNNQWTELAGVVVGYLFVEGSADVVDRYTGASQVPQQLEQIQKLIEDDDIDTSTVVAGTPMFDEQIKK